MMLKPMLAATWDEDLHSRYIETSDGANVWVVSPKLDGIRCIVEAGVGGYSRRGKPFPNVKLDGLLREVAQGLGKDGEINTLRALDGELIIGDGRGSDTWGNTQSAVMSHDGDLGRLQYRVFDGITSVSSPWYSRWWAVNRWIDRYSRGFGYLPIGSVEHHSVKGVDELIRYMDRFVELGYEGAMLRYSPADYKHGRSTGRQAFLVKLKKWDYGEARIVSVEPLYHNENEPVRGADGKLRRSSAREGLVARSTMGTLTLDNGVRIGTGFTAEMRDRVWEFHLVSHSVVGTTVRYKHVASVGESSVRHPVYVSGLENFL